MEKSHAELEQYHYQALKNPTYQQEFMMDVLREELMMNMPCPKPSAEPQVETTVRHVSVYDFASKRQVARIYNLEERLIGLEAFIRNNKRKQYDKANRYNVYKD